VRLNTIGSDLERACLLEEFTFEEQSMARERVQFRASQDGSFVDMAFDPLLRLSHVLHRQWKLLEL
jgi:hypothetical protein